MLKKSLLTAIVLGAFLSAAGAQNEDVAEATRCDESQNELDLDTPEMGCRVDAAETQSRQLFGSFLEPQSSTQLEVSGLASSIYGSWGSRRCMMCTWWICVPVPC